MRWCRSCGRCWTRCRPDPHRLAPDGLRAACAAPAHDAIACPKTISQRALARTLRWEERQQGCRRQSIMLCRDPKSMSVHHKSSSNEGSTAAGDHVGQAAGAPPLLPPAAAPAAPGSAGRGGGAAPAAGAAASACTELMSRPHCSWLSGITTSTDTGLKKSHSLGAAPAPGAPAAEWRSAAGRREQDGTAASSARHGVDAGRQPAGHPRQAPSSSSRRQAAAAAGGAAPRPAQHPHPALPRGARAHLGTARKSASGACGATASRTGRLLPAPRPAGCSRWPQP